MITLLSGENNFELTQALQAAVSQFDGVTETIDGSELETKQLPDLLSGGTLFSDKRLVIIRGLSENKSVWNDLSNWLTRVSDDIHLILVDTKPDKRTKTYKDLAKIADVRDFPAWTERDGNRAQQWVVTEAKKMGGDIDKNSAWMLVDRVGVDQWQLYHAIEKLLVLDVITPRIIEQVIDVNPSENVFNLFDAALRGDRNRVIEMLRTLERTEEPYMVFGLLSSQAFQLAALAVSDKSSSEVAKDIGAHPFALSKLSTHASTMNRSHAKKIITAFADADTLLKTSSTSPWIQIERTLIAISN